MNRFLAIATLVCSLFYADIAAAFDVVINRVGDKKKEVLYDVDFLGKFAAKHGVFSSSRNTAEWLIRDMLAAEGHRGMTFVWNETDAKNVLRLRVMSVYNPEMVKLEKFGYTDTVEDLFRYEIIGPTDVPAKLQEGYVAAVKKFVFADKAFCKNYNMDEKTTTVRSGKRPGTNVWHVDFIPAVSEDQKPVAAAKAVAGSQ